MGSKCFVVGIGCDNFIGWNGFSFLCNFVKLVYVGNWYW